MSKKFNTCYLLLDQMTLWHASVETSLAENKENAAIESSYINS